MQIFVYLDMLLWHTGKPKENSRKRKLLKADQLLPESKIKPIGSKKRKVHLKRKQREDFSNSSSDSEIEEERGKLVKAQINKKKPKTAAVFDLWEAQGKDCAVITKYTMGAVVFMNM